ncbi:MAG: DUF4252 domain-containing protein [Flavobacteriaceae bacterium]|nr:DUF4252 domain-containing protein [Flavobacteriaceae bacterium]
MMKRVILFAFTVLLFTSCKTSQSSFDNFYQNHKGQSEFSIKVPAFLANLFLKNDDMKEVKPLLKKAKSYRLMVFEENPQNLQKEFVNFVKQHHYQPLMKVKNGKDNVGFYVFKEQNRIKEIVMNVRDKNSVVMMSMKTNLSEEEVANLMNAN